LSVQSSGSSSGHPHSFHSLTLACAIQPGSGSLQIPSDTCYWLVPISLEASPSVGILILSSLWIPLLGT
jgi:hypothetical protein